MRLVDASGNIVAEYTYDPYGNILTATGDLAQINPLRYRGYYYDTELGMYFLNSRYYDPKVARFINADRYASTGLGAIGFNMYAYCNSNPINNADNAGSAFKTVLQGGVDGSVGFGGSAASSGTSSTYTSSRSNREEARKRLIKDITEIIHSDLTDDVYGVLKVNKGYKKIVKGFTLLLAPFPTLADEFRGVAEIGFGIKKIIDGLFDALDYGSD